MASIVPPLNSKGFFQVSSPWVMPASTVYECIAIREFQDFVNIGDDVFSLVYEPQGLARDVYEADRAAGAKIITLAAVNRPKIFVPSTYITSYPMMDNVAYSRVVISGSLGPLPDAMDLTFLVDQIKGVISDVIGVTTAEVKVNTAPSDTYFTAEQHAQLEQARQTAISNRTTDLARLREAQALIAELRAVNAQYVQIMKDHGILPPG